MRPPARHRLIAAAALALAIASGGGGQAAAAPVAIPLRASDAPGLRPLPAGSAAGRALLRSALGSRGRAVVSGATLAGSALARRDSRVVSGVAIVRDAAAARTLRRIVAGIGTRAPGQPGIVRLRSTRAGVIAVAADGRAAAAVRLTRTDRNARAAAATWARLLAARAGTAADRPAWGRVLQDVGPSGRVSRRTALAAFSLAYGPIPGVSVPAGPAGDGPDGTVVLAWIARRLRSLSPAQRAAISSRLGVALPGSAHASGPGAPLKRDARLEAMADGFSAQFQQRTGHALRLDIQAGWVPSLTREHAGGAAADALPLDAGGELSYTNAATCRIRISRADHGSASAAYLANTVAHEVFHCVQFDAAPTRWSREDGTWVIEGGAEWAASQVAPVRLSEVSSSPEDYFAGDQPLFGLAHAAAYFWGRLAETNGPPWVQTLAAAREYENDRAFRLAGATSDAFLDAWAPSYARLGGAGPAWTTAAPVAVPAAVAPTPAPPVTADALLSAPPYANRLFRLAPVADQVVARIEAFKGRVRLSDGKQDVKVGADDETWLCVGGGCRCPAGQELSVPQIRDVGATVTVAIGGATESGSAGVVFYRLRDLCVGEGPEFCPTSQPLRYPKSQKAAVAWVDARIDEQLRLEDVLLPMAEEANGVGAELDALGGYTPGTPKADQEHHLRNELWGVELREWPSWCRYQEIGVHFALVYARAAKLKWGGLGTPLYRAALRFQGFIKRWMPLIHSYGGMPGHNPAASGPPFPGY